MTTYFDPRFALPPLKDAEYKATSLIDDALPVAESSPVETATVESDALRPPESIQIVEQIVKRSSDGKIIVDLVIEVEDVIGANKYEYRLSKV